jgi:hypothetical protein
VTVSLGFRYGGRGADAVPRWVGGELRLMRPARVRGEAVVRPGRRAAVAVRRGVGAVRPRREVVVRPGGWAAVAVRWVVARGVGAVWRQREVPERRDGVAAVMG